MTVQFKKIFYCLTDTTGTTAFTVAKMKTDYVQLFFHVCGVIFVKRELKKISFFFFFFTTMRLTYRMAGIAIKGMKIINYLRLGMICSFLDRDFGGEIFF